MHSTHSEAPLIVYIDFKSPYAYLAVEPTRKMLARLGVVADWRPFVLDIGSYLGTAKLGKSGKVKEQSRSAEQWSGVKYAYFDCRRYANLRDLMVRGTVKIWNTDLPAIGMFWLKQQETIVEQCQPGSLLNKFLDAVYEPFWKRELDVEQLDVVEGILQRIGADVTGFKAYAEGPGQAFNTEFQHATFAAGVYGVPTYIVDAQASGATQKYFGREHLPRIAWHLTGEQGEAPDIAYEGFENAAQVETHQAGLTVCVDFKSPSAYLAVAPTLAMAAQKGVQLDWQIIATPALREPVNPGPEADRSVLHRYTRGRYIADDLQRYAPHPLNNLYETERSDRAAIGLLWVIQRQGNTNAYVGEVFDRYWKRNEGIDDIADITTVLAQLEIETSGFETFAAEVGAQQALKMREDSSAKGVTTSPTYLIADEPFQGRQHLPLLADLLSSD